MGKSRLFFCFLLTIILGVILSSLLPTQINPKVIFLIFLSLLITSIFFWEEKIVSLSALGLISFLFGVWYGKEFGNSTLISFPENLKTPLLFFQNKLQLTFQRVLPEPFTSLLQGILLGIKTNLPKKLLADFKTTGLIHIMVASGYNILILIKVFRDQTQAYFGRFSFWLTSLAILFFVLLIGSPPSAVRAGIMGIFLILARYLGRKELSFISICFAAFLMILAKPTVWRELSFLLSFAATLGIIYLSPIFQRLINQGWFQKWIPPIFLSAFSETMGAQLMVLPILLSSFGRISIISPLANILILPLIPFVMSFGFFLLIIGMIWVFLGQILGWILYLPLNYIVWLTENLAKVSFASILLPHQNWLFVFFYYLILSYFIFWYYRARKWKILIREGDGF